MSSFASEASRTFTISSSNNATTSSNLAQTAAKIEHDQVVAQYANQLKQLSVQYEQNQLQNAALALQNTQQLAASQNDVMSQRFATNNAYLQQLQNILNSKLQNANEGVQVQNEMLQRSNETQKGVSSTLDKNAPNTANTKGSVSKSKQLVNELATEIQKQQVQNNLINKDQSINTDYTNTTTSLLSQMANTQRAFDNTAANNSSQLSALNYNANNAAMSKQETLNKQSYDSAYNQATQTMRQAKTKYLSDLQNLSRIESSNSSVSSDSSFGRSIADIANGTLANYISTGGDARSTPTNTNRNVGAAPAYFLNGREVTREEYLK